MFRFFMILIFLLALTIHATTSHAAFTSHKCMNLFDEDDLTMSIDNLIEPSFVKRKLIQQARHNQNSRKFILEYMKLLDELYENRLFEILLNQNYEDFTKAGFKSPREARRLKEDVIHKQIAILSYMKPEGFTPEFVLEFTRITTRMYSAHITRDETLAIYHHLNDMIKTLK